MYKNVFIYWVGQDYKLIKILRELIYKHSNFGKNYTVTLLNRENIEEHIVLPTCFDDLLPAHQADYVRVCIIYKYGGIWLDSDTLVMSDLSILFNNIDEYDGFLLRENNKVICNGVFGSKPGTSLLNNWIIYINSILNTKTITNIKWSEIGSNFFLKCDKNLFSNYMIYNGLDNIYPINWDMCVEEYINKDYSNYNTIIRDVQPLLVLVNGVYKELENSYNILDFGTERIPLNYFLNKSNKIIYD